MFILSGKPRAPCARWLSTSLVLSLVFLQACDGSSKPKDEEVATVAPVIGDTDNADPTTEVDSALPAAELYSPEFYQGFNGSYALDFDADTVFFNTFSFDDSTGESSAKLSDSSIVLTAQSDGTGYANRYMKLGNGFRSVAVSAEFDAETSLSEMPDSFATVGLEANLYNLLADNGAGGENPFVGNVNLDFRVSISGSGNSQAQLCLGSYGVDNYNPVALLDDGSNCWMAPSSLELKKGDLFTYGYTFDFDARTLTAFFNEDRLGVELQGNLFKPYGSAEAGLQVIQEGGPGTAVVNITDMQLNDRAYDFSVDNVVLDQIEIRSDAGPDEPRPSVVDNQFQFSIVSIDGEYQEQALRQLLPSDYLEATITLSSLSVIETGRVQGRLESVLYNDLDPEERDGRTGDVRASIELNARADGTRAAEVCLVRSSDADFDDRQGLLGNGEDRCHLLPMKVELDKPYRVAIALDRSASKVIFRVNGIVVSVDVLTSIFDASEPSARIVASANDGATVVALVDDIRTSPTALTQSEEQAGLDTVPAFPVLEVASPASSEIEPVFNHVQALNFIDDFSVDSRQFGFNFNINRGKSGIGYTMGGIELRTVTNPELSDDSNYSELYINGRTQAIKARVSLSSDSELPEDPEARALIRVQGHLLRDNLDYEPGNRTGDIYSSIEISMRGDGRRRISYYVSRRVDGAEDERLDILDGDNGATFDEINPMLDTDYELGIRFDEERNMLVFSVDDIVHEYALPWQAFPAAQNNAIVQLQHSGSSGRAIGHFYGVETDTVFEDFGIAFPLMGPYRPAFEVSYESENVQVVDGRLKLSSDARVTGSRPARLIALGESNYVAARLTLSSESIVASSDSDDGIVAARIGGLMYRAQQVQSDADDTGKVYATVHLVKTFAGEMFAEYCAFQSIDEDFSDSIELIGGDTNNCPRFTTPVEMDTEYATSVSYDEVAKTLVFSINDEQVVFDIRGDNLKVVGGFQGPQARAFGQSRAVVFVDDLAYSASPVALAESDQRLVIVSAP